MTTVTASIAEKWAIIRAKVSNFDQILTAVASTITCLEGIRARISADQIMFAKRCDPIIDEKGVVIEQYQYAGGAISELADVLTGDSEIRRMLVDYDTTREVMVCIINLTDTDPLIFCKIPYEEKLKLGLYVMSQRTYIGIERNDIVVVRRKKCDSSGCNVLKGTKKCARCKKVRYCSKECQRADWPTHKKICKTADL